MGCLCCFVAEGVYASVQSITKREYRAMLTPEERALLIEQQDRLIELLVQKQEASDAENWDRFRELQTEIDDAQGQLEIIRQLEAAS